jgi:hypothetical protein
VGGEGGHRSGMDAGELETTNAMLRPGLPGPPAPPKGRRV